MTTTSEPTLHEMLYTLVEQRRPGGDMNHSQVIRLGVIKLVEEALEAAMAIAQPRQLSRPMDALSEEVRECFRERVWLNGAWAKQGPSEYSLARLKEELADLYVVLAHLEQEINMLTGEEWSMQAAAMEKATADLRRTEERG